MEHIFCHCSMAALSHVNAASAVPSHNICTTKMSNEIKYFLPNLQYYPSIMPVCFISELPLAFWLSWLKFSILLMSGSTLLEAQIILIKCTLCKVHTVHAWWWSISQAKHPFYFQKYLPNFQQNLVSGDIYRAQTMILIGAALLWDVMLCSLVCRYQHYERTHWKWRQYISPNCCCVFTRVHPRRLIFVSTTMRPSKGFDVSVLYVFILNSGILSFPCCDFSMEGGDFSIWLAAHNYHCWKAVKFLLFNWSLCSSRMWCIIAEQLVSHILRQPSGHVFRGLSVQEEFVLSNHPMVWWYIPEEQRPQLHCCKSLKAY